MNSANIGYAGALRTGLLAAIALIGAAPAHAGGPLYLVPVGNHLEPAHWVGTVNVYLDSGNLNVGTNCLVDENYNCQVDGNGNPIYPVLDQQAGDDLVAATVAQWSNVPNSSFRAQIAGRSPVDITGANVWDYIGVYNGGGIQTIYDADNTVIEALTGGDAYGVLGIASPEWLSDVNPTEIVEGWQVIGGSFLSATTTEQISGVVTHEFGHAINLSHTQTNGFYAMNNPNAWSYYAGGGERAGPDQCEAMVTDYPSASQIETMYPMIDPFPDSPTYNSPEMAKVLDDADDMAALASIYPAPGYSAATGTIHGKIVAKDGTSQLTGVNVIARRVDQPLEGAMSRISGDSTQGLLGADGTFTMTGLEPGVEYVLYIDQLRAGAFSTPPALLLGPEEYWNDAESGDASKDDACAYTPIALAAGETRELTIAVNGIPDAPTFTQIPYVLPIVASDDGSKIAGLYGPSNESPYWVWDQETFAATGDVRYIGGRGVNIAMSGDGNVVGGTVPGPTVTTGFGQVVQERAALWTRRDGWRTITGGTEDWPGCDIFHTSVYDVSRDGSTAVGLAFKDCTHAYAYKWTQKTGMQLLVKNSAESARANAVSGDGKIVAGWQDANRQFPYRLGAIWRGKNQLVLHEPRSRSQYNWKGWVGEATAVNAWGSVVVGVDAGPDLNDSYIWTVTRGTQNIGGDRTPICFFSWEEQTDVCKKRRTAAYSISDDARVITGESTYSDFMNGVFAIDGAIFTRGLGWMQLSKFLESQGVLEATNWVFYGAKVSGNGKVIYGTAFPLASNYYQGYRISLDKVFVCHAAKGGAKTTLRVGFPGDMDSHLKHGDAIGLCPGDAPL